MDSENPGRGTHQLAPLPSHSKNTRTPLETTLPLDDCSNRSDKSSLLLRILLSEFFKENLMMLEPAMHAQ